MSRANQSQNTAAFETSVESYAKIGLRTDEEQAIARYFPPAPATVLVVGCGAGRTVIPLIELGYTVTGMDISEGMIAEAEKQVARRGLTAELFVGDAAQLRDRLPGRTFDVILLPFHVICFIAPLEQRRKFLEAAATLLRDDGVLIYNTYNRLFPRTLRMYSQHHDGPYAELNSLEGKLWGYTALPWTEAKSLRPWFARAEVLPRYALIPPMPTMKWKERVARIISPIADKSIYVIAKKTDDGRPLSRDGAAAKEI